MSYMHEYYDRYWSETAVHCAESRRNTPYFVKYLVESIRRLGIGPTNRKGCALDLGCGEGYFTNALAEMGFDCVGVDISEKVLAENRQKYPTLRFEFQDLQQPLNFDDHSFDLVWCSEVLEHLCDPLHTIKEIERVLCVGGGSIVTVPYHGLLKNVLIALFAFERHYDPEYPHVQYFTRNTLSRLFEKAGLKVMDVSTCGIGVLVRDKLLPTNLLLTAQKP